MRKDRRTPDKVSKKALQKEEAYVLGRWLKEEKKKGFSLLNLKKRATTYSKESVP